MSDYRIETVMESDTTSFYIHRVDSKETRWVASCDNLAWANKVKSALEWLDTANSWLDNTEKRMSLPPSPRKRAVRKPVAKKCVKKRS